MMARGTANFLPRDQGNCNHEQGNVQRGKEDDSLYGYVVH